MEAVIAVLFWLAVMGGIVGLILHKRARSRAEEARRKAEAAERKRVQECGEVVLFFANHFGYIAKQCISRDELEELIDDGISPEELS